MRKRYAALLAGLLGLMLVGAPPAAAQSDPAPAAEIPGTVTHRLPVPRSYPRDGFERADRAPPPETLARDTAAADTAAAACDSGDPAGCTALGTAFETGTGRPQSRPVAELLYRQACSGADGAGCLKLADLLRYADDRAMWAISGEFYVRACRLGVTAGCDVEANDVEAGVFAAPDPEAAMAMRRAICAGGNAASCHRLASLLIAPDRTPGEQAEGRILFERLCRAGQAEDCAMAARAWRIDEDGFGPRTREFEWLACGAGDGAACAGLGTALMRGVWDGGGTGEDPRMQASALFDQACARATWYCETARVLRDEETLDRDCANGVAEACLLLARVYREEGGPLPDLPRAALLQGAACDALPPASDPGEVCTRAGEAALAQLEAGAPGFDPARIDAWLARGCTPEWRSACIELANALAEGTALPGDMPRALAIYQTQCDAGYPDGCSRLRRASSLVPDAPLLVAAADTPPPEYSDEEVAAMEQADFEAQQRLDEEMNADACTTTEVTFRGATYSDTICNAISAVINGFVVRVGDAPWQALLWRPEVLGQRRLAMADRVLCGGAVIRPGWVLTAAHCLTDEIDGVRYGVRSSGHRIRLGVYNPLANEGFSYPILNVIPHPNFKRSTWVYDIALVQYDPRAGRKEGGPVRSIATIRLDSKPLAQRVIKARMPAYTFGWGRTAVEGGATPSQLRGARLELEGSERCTELTALRDTRRNAVLCAAGPQGQQACFGDSGGPLITYGDSGMGPTVIGVVSSGVKCGTTGVPSRFTRIAHPRVQSWLTSHLPGLR